MYHIVAKDSIKKKVLEKYPDIKEPVLKEMFIGIANEMKVLENCFEVTEREQIEAIEIEVECFVMPKKNLNKALKIINSLKETGSLADRSSLSRLESLLTKPN